MAIILKGSPVAQAIMENVNKDIELLKGKGVVPTLAVIRTGENPDDIAYENSAAAKCEKAGITLKRIALPSDVEQEKIELVLEDLNRDDSVHGILILWPLPGHLDQKRIREILDPRKDMDGCSYGSLSGLYSNSGIGYPPCTAEAVMRMLEHYEIEVSGKKVAVIGRSLVIGLPVATMLIYKNATVVNCHTKTPDVPSITKQADILIATAGSMRLVDENYVRENQVVIDVGINWDSENKVLVGDVDFHKVEPFVSSISPVPGGVGNVTTALLISHVVEAAKKAERLL